MPKVTRAEDGTFGNVEETSILDAVIIGVMAPLKMISNDKNVYYSEDVLGIAAGVALAEGVAVERLTDVSEIFFPV